MSKTGDNNTHTRAPRLSAVTDAFLEHSRYLKSFLHRYIHRQQDIEDIAQEAYIRAFKVEQDAEVGHPKTLLFTIAKNIALNELRSKARRVTDYMEECQTLPEQASSTAEDEVVAFEYLEHYCAAVDNLPEQCRRVYLLRKVHGLSHKEIAERLQITVRTVERHLQKGMLRCRTQLREQGMTSGVDPESHVAKNPVTTLHQEEAQ